MGGELVESLPDPLDPVLGGGQVVALGREVEADARLYGRLTGRSVQVASDRTSLENLDDLAVIVTTEDRVDFELLNALYSDSRRDVAPGLIYSHSPDLLRQQVLARSAAAYLCVDASLHRVDLFPERSVRTTRLQDWTILGSEASADEMRAVLLANAGVLRVLTHADGIDAFLRRDLALCPLEPEPANAPRDMQPLCKLIDFCYRTQEPISVAHQKRLTLHARDIAARILVFDVCWGLRPPPDVNHAAWGYTRQLLQTFQIGALLTTWEIVQTEPRISTRLVDAISEGMPVGRALAAHLWAPERQGDGHRMCLVGDPACRIPPRLHCSLEPLLRAESEPQLRERMMTALSFIRAYVHRVRQSHHRVFTDRSGQVLAALDAYESVLFSPGGGEPSHGAQAADLRKALADFLSSRWGVAISTWSAWIASLRYLPGTLRCWACGRTARVFEAELSLPGRPRRVVTECPNCGSICDVPQGRSVRFEVKPGGVISLHGDTQGAHAVVIIHSHRLGPVVPWPADESGALAPEFVFHEAWDQGPARVAIFIVWENFELGVLGYFVRGERLLMPRST